MKQRVLRLDAGARKSGIDSEEIGQLMDVEFDRRRRKELTDITVSATNE